MSEPVHGGPVTDFLDDLFHQFGTEAEVEAELNRVLDLYAQPVFLRLSPAPDVIDRNLLYPPLKNLLVSALIEGHKRIHTEG
jgi:hypothetical protein